MDHSVGLPFLRETLLFLVLAGVLIPLLQRFRVNQVIGFLVVGILVGPYGFVLWADQFAWVEVFSFPRGPGVQSLGELGVIFLMFLIGLELSVKRMWAMRRWVFLGGSAQVLLSAIVIGVIAYAFGNALNVSVVLGLVLSLSSTAVVMQLMTQQRALAQPLGQAAFAILMMQDVVVVPLLVLIDIFAKDTGAGLAELMSLAALKSIGVVVLIFLVGRKVIRPLFRMFAQQHQPEVFMALTLLVAFGTAGATAAAGLSLALGALIAGLLMAETEYRNEVEVTIEPFKGLLMGLFFMSVGMGIDVREVANLHYWVIASVLGLMGIKATIAAGLFRLGGLSWGKSIEGGMLLAQGGEFAFVVLGAAASLGLLKPDVAQFMLLVVSLSLMVTPVVAYWGVRIGRWLDGTGSGVPRQMEVVHAHTQGGHIVIAGQGRVGQLLADVFAKQGAPYVAIEHDAPLVARLVKQGRPVIYGNAARPDLLRKVHTQSAKALVVTMDQPVAAMHTVRAARIAYPNLPIFARSRDELHAQELRAAGATAVVPETLEAGLQLSGFALHSLGLPESLISAALQDERESRVASA
jgi:CPA2 family monovalent cation:H+ antiporter-2